MLLAYKGPILVALAVMAVVATSVVYGVVSTKREATRARLAEAEAQRSAAELLIQDAQAAARVGDTFRARRATSQSLQTRDSPQARGLWMYLSSAAKPTLVASQPLGECARWFILAVDDVVLCRASQTILQGWAGEKKIWELEQDNVELRADADRLYILDSQRTLLVVDVHTGAVVERDSRPGLFINPQGHERMTLVGDGWIHADWAMPNCAYGISESVFDAQTRWHLCKSGEVFKETDGRLEPVQIFSDVPNLMTVARDGALWGGTRHGTIRRVDATSRTLELGESLERIDVVPGSDLLLAVGRKSALRLFDPRTVQWVASYPDAAMVRATSSGVWLLREGRLEKWSVPSPTVWRYRSDHGMAFAAWSRDGARVAAVDGGGNYHEFWPHKGVALPPEQFTASVGKAVFPSATGEFFAVGTRSDWILRMNTLDGKVLPTHAYDYLGSPRFAIFANGQAFSPSWAPGIRLLYLDRPVQNMQSVGSVFEVRMSADYETAVLFERETVWRWHQN